VRFDDAYASLWNILHDEEQAMALSLRRHAMPIVRKTMHCSPRPGNRMPSKRYHEAMTPVLRKLEAVADCAHLRSRPSARCNAPTFRAAIEPGGRSAS